MNDTPGFLQRSPEVIYDTTRLPIHSDPRGQTSLEQLLNSTLSLTMPVFFKIKISCSQLIRIKFVQQENKVGAMSGFPL